MNYPNLGLVDSNTDHSATVYRFHQDTSEYLNGVIPKIRKGIFGVAYHKNKFHILTVSDGIYTTMDLYDKDEVDTLLTHCITFISNLDYKGDTIEYIIPKYTVLESRRLKDFNISFKDKIDSTPIMSIQSRTNNRVISFELLQLPNLIECLKFVG